MAEMSGQTLPPDDSRGGNILGISFGTLIPAILVVCARIYARIQSRAFGFDDACIIVSTLISIVGAAFNVLEVQSGFGRHIAYLSKEDLSNIEHWLYGAQTQAGIGIAITKISICWFVLRLLGPTYRWMHIVIWANMVFILIVTVVFVFFQAFSCIPLAKLWNPELPGTCLGPGTISRVELASDIIDVITDFLCAALPILVIASLKLDRRTKWALIPTIGFGFLTAATSIGKAVSVESHALDPTWSLVEVTYWVVLEENISILVASLPGLRQCFRIVHGRIEESRKSRTTGQQSGTTSGSGPKGVLQQLAIPQHRAQGKDDIELSPLVEEGEVLVDGDVERQQPVASSSLKPIR